MSPVTLKGTIDKKHQKLYILLEQQHVSRLLFDKMKNPFPFLLLLAACSDAKVSSFDGIWQLLPTEANGDVYVEVAINGKNGREFLDMAGVNSFTLEQKGDTLFGTVLGEKFKYYHLSPDTLLLMNADGALEKYARFRGAPSLSDTLSAQWHQYYQFKAQAAAARGDSAAIAGLKQEMWDFLITYYETSVHQEHPEEDIIITPDRN